MDTQGAGRRNSVTPSVADLGLDKGTAECKSFSIRPNFVVRTMCEVFERIVLRTAAKAASRIQIHPSPDPLTAIIKVSRAARGSLAPQDGRLASLAGDDGGILVRTY